MLKDNRNYNAQVTSNTAFLKTLRDKLPEFFTELDFLLSLHQRKPKIIFGNFILTKLISFDRISYVEI